MVPVDFFLDLFWLFVFVMQVVVLQIGKHSDFDGHQGPWVPSVWLEN